MITTHGDAEAAVHEHSRDTVTATVPLPPLAANDRADPSKLGWQRPGVLEGVVMLVLAELPHPASAAHAAAMVTEAIVWKVARGTTAAHCISSASAAAAKPTRNAPIRAPSARCDSIGPRTRNTQFPLLTREVPGRERHAQPSTVARNATRGARIIREHPEAIPVAPRREVEQRVPGDRAEGSCSRVRNH